MTEAFLYVYDIGEDSGLYMCKLFLKLPAKCRIGPHNEDIVSIQVGSILGDGHLEQHGQGSRQCFQQEHSHKAYATWLHDYLAIRGYSNPSQLIVNTRLGLGGKLRYLYRFKTWTYTSFNTQHAEFYCNNIKILPKADRQYQYITPLSLAIWIMDEGCRSGKGLKIASNNFTYKECEQLQSIIKDKYNLQVSIHKSGHANQHCLYIPKASINSLYDLIGEYIHPCMRYKFAI